MVGNPFLFAHSPSSGDQSVRYSNYKCVIITLTAPYCVVLTVVQCAELPVTTAVSRGAPALAGLSGLTLGCLSFQG